MAAMTIEQYLQVIPNFVFPDNCIQKAMGLNGISAGSLAFSDAVGWERKRDLAEAYMWEQAVGLVSSMAGGKKQVGNRSISAAAIQCTAADRDNWRRNANALRIKWGVDPMDVEIGGISDVSFFWGADTDY
jgi:hypothetical protein